MTSAELIFDLIAQNTTDLVCIHDLDNTIRFATPSSNTILGYSPEELSGKKLTDFLSNDFINEMDFNTLRRFFDHPGSRIRYQVKHREGRLLWLETTFTKVGEKGLDEFEILSSTRDITESVHLMDDLMAALAKEHELSKFKSNLYSIASHEFKTPLAVIQANIEMLKVKSDRGLLDMALDSMEEEIDKLNAMIADMLQLKKLTTGRTAINPIEIDVVKLIREVVETDLRKAYPKFKVNMKFNEEAETTIKGDLSLIRYVFSNLLGNACKFSDKKHIVDISVERGDETVSISIKDYGIGIPEEDMPFIFRSFYRARNVGNISGTGVGLSIVKEFVDLHHGNITIDSKEKKGTTFFIDLPVKM